MSSVTVNLVFQGLIAFSPIYQTNHMASQMTALAVDSRVAPSNSVCVVDHMVMLEFPAAAPDCQAAPGCSWSGGTCSCHLDRQEIELLGEANPTSIAIPQGPPPSLPLDKTPSTAGSFAYVARLPNLGNFTLDPQFLATNPPAALAARFTFEFDSLLACNHAVRPDNQTDNVHSFQFRKLGDRGKPEQLHQAIAQTLVATLTVDTTNGDPVLRLRQFGSTAHSDIPLDVSNPDEDVDVWIMNHRPDSPLPFGNPCDDGIGRDFALYYELTEDPPAWSKRVLPHVKLAPSKPHSDVDPAQCSRFKAPMSRPVCPLVGF